ncbi:ABC transporter permease [Deltaproteobacteria bacterium TL4]
MNSALLQLVLSQMRLFFRNPGVLFWSFLFPLILSWILGISFDQRGESLRNIAVLEEGGQPPVEFLSWFQRLTGVEIPASSLQTGQFDITLRSPGVDTTHFRFHLQTGEEIERALKRTKILLFMTFPNPDSPTFHFDPQNAEAQLCYLLLTRFSAKEGTLSKTDVKTLQTQGTRYIDFLIPGLLALSVMNTCLWGVGWVLIEMRIKKLLRRIVITPLNKSVFLISQMLTRLLMGGLEFVCTFGFAYYYFGVRIQGSLMGLLLIALSGFFCFFGIAVLISSRAASTQAGNGLINTINMPMFITSGIFFSYHSFPDWLIPWIQYLPLTLLADGLRGVFVESLSIQELLQPSLMLLIQGSISFYLGLKIYKWY